VSQPIRVIVDIDAEGYLHFVEARRVRDEIATFFSTWQLVVIWEPHSKTEFDDSVMMKDIGYMLLSKKTVGTLYLVMSSNSHHVLDTPCKLNNSGPTSENINKRKTNQCIL